MTDDTTTVTRFSDRVAIERWEGEGGRAASWEELDRGHGGESDEPDESRDVP